MKIATSISLGCVILFALFILASCDNNPQPKATMPAAAPGVANKGEQMFKIKCMQCHMPAKDFAAPALAGAASRWNNKGLLYEFVRNSSEVIKKDEYAAALFKKWNEAPMLPFPDLTDDEIDAILKYCDEYAATQ